MLLLTLAAVVHSELHGGGAAWGCSSAGSHHVPDCVNYVTRNGCVGWSSFLPRAEARCAWQQHGGGAPPTAPMRPRRYELPMSVVRKPGRACADGADGGTRCSRTVVPRCPTAGFIAKEPSQWIGCCFDHRKDCLPLAGAAKHGWRAAVVPLMHGFQFGKAPYLAVPVSAAVNSAADCRAKCLRLAACAFGTFISSGARTGECWLAASTHVKRHPPCIGACASFSKVLLPAAEATSGGGVRGSVTAAMLAAAAAKRTLPPAAAVAATTAGATAVASAGGSGSPQHVPLHVMTSPTVATPTIPPALSSAALPAKASVHVGTGNSTACGAMTGLSVWRLLGVHGALYTDVDTSMCHFEQRVRRQLRATGHSKAEIDALLHGTKATTSDMGGVGGARQHAAAGLRVQYVSAIVGDERHWQLSGTHIEASSDSLSFSSGSDGGASNSNSNNSNNSNSSSSSSSSSNAASPRSFRSFRVIAYHPSLRGPTLLRAARALRWEVSWVGDTGRNSGRTTPGATGWKRVPRDEQGSGGGGNSGGGLYVDVNTAPCGFRFGDQPRYFPSLSGRVFGRFMRAVSGAHVVYYSHFAGFRVYVAQPACLCSPLPASACLCLLLLVSSQSMCLSFACSCPPS